MCQHMSYHTCSPTSCHHVSNSFTNRMFRTHSSITFRHHTNTLNTIFFLQKDWVIKSWHPANIPKGKYFSNFNNTNQNTVETDNKNNDKRPTERNNVFSTAPRPVSYAWLESVTMLYPNWVTMLVEEGVKNYLL